MITLTRPEGSEPADFHLSRRSIAGLFFTGYAAFSLSARAEPIVTDSAGLAAEQITVPAAGGDLPLYLARPDKPGRFPVVLVIPEVFGIHEYIRDVCRRFAKLGYVAVAPGLFFRAGDPAPLQDFDKIKAIVETATNEQVMGDLAVTLAWLETQAFVDRKRMAVTGFCWGGAVTWMAAARFRQLRAGVAWYGRLTHPPAGGFLGAENRPWPVDVAGDLQGSVLGLYAGLDKGIPPSDIEAMKAALKAHHKSADFVVYPDAQHGFHADYRDTYNKADAEDGWKRLLAWFATHGVKPGAR